MPTSKYKTRPAECVTHPKWCGHGKDSAFSFCWALKNGYIKKAVLCYGCGYFMGRILKDEL